VAADLCPPPSVRTPAAPSASPPPCAAWWGIKPTYGRVSRFGLVAFASSLDQIGPVTKEVRDAALLLQAIAGHDPRDSTAAPEPVPDYAAALGKDIKGLKIGVPREYFGEGLDPEVEAAVRAALATLAGLGADIVEVSLPHTGYAVATYYIVAMAEASSNLARYDGVKYGFRAPGGNLLEMYAQTRTQGFGAEVRRRIMLGTYTLSAGYYDAYFRKASQVRTLIRRDFDRALETCAVLAAPVAPTPAFRLGEKTDDPLTMYLSDIFTISANLAGIPGISLPAGLSREGLPIGLQLLGPPFGEPMVLQVAHAFEQATDFHRRKPPLA
jgi:aspartyl-tRNA(Asn)/glutamyl-tRNA(Gln) amidotransferase subunit A